MNTPRWAGAVAFPWATTSGAAALAHCPQKAEDRVMPVTSAKQHSLATPVTLSQRVIIAVGASLLGLCLVYFAGFSHIEAVHNAAHDTRHSAAFPCH
jgi:cobalt transporter subunit CbtB